MKSKTYMWNEIQQVGTDYENPEEVKAYDERMSTFRDVDSENRKVCEKIKLHSADIVIEVGVGTGAFAIMASQCCKQVIALDVSPVMLEYAAQKAEKNGVRNIDFYQAGFLSYEHTSDLVDSVVSSVCLHHLPDMWKLVALKRIYSWLKPGGLFYLQDVIFPAERVDDESYFNEIITSVPVDTQDEFRNHIACEYSTLDVCMELLLKEAGFEILEQTNTNKYMYQYVCKSNAE